MTVAPEQENHLALSRSRGGRGIFSDRPSAMYAAIRLLVMAVVPSASDFYPCDEMRLASRGGSEVIGWTLRQVAHEWRDLPLPAQLP